MDNFFFICTKNNTFYGIIKINFIWILANFRMINEHTIANMFIHFFLQTTVLG